MLGRIALLTSAVLAGNLLGSLAAYAADTVKPAVIYDLGGKFDKSFNEGVFNGATQFTKETGIKFPRSRNPERGAARAGPAQVRQGRLLADHDGRLRLGDRAEEGRAGIPQDRSSASSMRRRPAQRAVDRVQGTGGLVPRRRDRGRYVQDRQGRFRRRHGHSADLEVRMRLRAGRQIRVRRQGRSASPT